MLYYFLILFIYVNALKFLIRKLVTTSAITNPGTAFVTALSLILDPRASNATIVKLGGTE